MKNSKQQLESYLRNLNNVENFSSFAGDADLSFGGDQGMSAAGVVVAPAACQTHPMRPAKPYSITFLNSTGANGAVFTLFGFNTWFNVPNFGSDAGIVITVGGNITYSELLAQSQRPFMVRRFRFLATTAFDLSQTLNVWYHDANGRKIEDVFDLTEHQDMYATNTLVLDTTFDATIDGSFYLQGTISASNSIRIIVYPEAMINTKNELMGLPTQMTYLQPVLSPAIAPQRPRPTLLAATKGLSS